MVWIVRLRDGKEVETDSKKYILKLRKLKRNPVMDVREIKQGEKNA